MNAIRKQFINLMKTFAELEKYENIDLKIITRAEEELAQADESEKKYQQKQLAKILSKHHEDISRLQKLNHRLLSKSTAIYNELHRISKSLGNKLKQQFPETEYFLSELMQSMQRIQTNIQTLKNLDAKEQHARAGQDINDEKNLLLLFKEEEKKAHHELVLFREHIIKAQKELQNKKTQEYTYIPADFYQLGEEIIFLDTSFYYAFGELIHKKNLHLELGACIQQNKFYTTPNVKKELIKHIHDGVISLHSIEIIDQTLHVQIVSPKSNPEIEEEILKQWMQTNKGAEQVAIRGEAHAKEYFRGTGDFEIIMFTYELHRQFEVYANDFDIKIFAHRKNKAYTLPERILKLVA